VTKRPTITLVVIAILILVAYGALYLIYGGFARGAIDDLNRMEERRAQGLVINLDTCYYSLKVPPNLDFSETATFDTTIVRGGPCGVHLLRFPPWGTQSDYYITGDGMVDSLGFTFDQDSLQWLDITTMVTGSYAVRLLACGNGGDFTLRIE